MALTAETRLVNFLLNALKRIGVLERALIDYPIQVVGGRWIKPDLFFLVKHPEGSENYEYFEFKQRKVLPDRDIARFQEQHDRARTLATSHLDPRIIPRLDDAPIFHTLLIHGSPEDIIDIISKAVSFSAEDAILIMKREQGQSHGILSLKKVPSGVSSQHVRLLESLAIHSNDANMWSNLLVPFTNRELSGIQGLGGAPGNVKIDPATSISILIANLFAFITQRKVRDQPARFNIRDLSEFIFRHLRGLARIAEEDLKDLEGKLCQFLDLLIQVSEKEGITLLEKVGGKTSDYMITVRKTDTMHTRLESLNRQLFTIIDDRRKQLKLDRFIQ